MTKERMLAGLARLEAIRDVHNTYGGDNAEVLFPYEEVSEAYYRARENFIIRLIDMVLRMRRTILSPRAGLITKR